MGLINVFFFLLCCYGFDQWGPLGPETLKGKWSKTIEADVFIKTCKRTKGREYKTQIEVMNYGLTTIQDLCPSGGNCESVKKLIGGDASHDSSWLIGRRALPKNLN